MIPSRYAEPDSDAVVVTSNEDEIPQATTPVGQTWSRRRVRTRTVPSAPRMSTWTSVAATLIGVGTGPSASIVPPGSIVPPEKKPPPLSRPAPTTTATAMRPATGSGETFGRRPPNRRVRRVPWASMTAAVRAHRSRGGSGRSTRLARSERCCSPYSAATAAQFEQAARWSSSQARSPACRASSTRMAASSRARSWSVAPVPRVRRPFTTWSPDAAGQPHPGPPPPAAPRRAPGEDSPGRG